MAGLIYVLDSNAISDYVNAFEPTSSRIDQAILETDIVYLSQAVRFEVVRGLLYTRAVRKLRIFNEELVPQLNSLPLVESDWEQAARFWVESRSKGKQLSDIDLLIAAQTRRMNATLITNDDDFDALPIRRENWRVAAG
jgi:predicted nucleic acid-binding protein